KNVNYFECNFASVKDLVGEGRYIVFKNVGGSEGDLYSNNYLDDITLTYVNVEDLECEIYSDYEETFESYMVGAEPDCWEVIAEDVALDSETRPQVYGNFNTTAGGSNSLRLKNRCVYAMPECSDPYPIGVMSMTFNLRQPKSIYRLQVGLVDEQGNFTALKTFKCSNTTDMQEMTLNFVDYDCSVGSRVAFRNTLVPGTGRRTDYLDYSINYIDDINLVVSDGNKFVTNGENAMDANASLDDIDVYPNPTTGNLYIDAMGIQKVECYNQMGQLVRVYDNVLNSIDLNNLSEGVYTLRITVPQGVTVRKVVKK
ncbi:MAG: T9SS type A sorting domain-containing protein, partial [Bacteroidales bacterium]|nr:T9SS type A sorting domain-containing protein [Bacteroidales bacterium]